MRRLFFLLTGFSLPLPALAAVYISEIAWMGDDRSANYEWLEIANNSIEDIDLTGFSLEAADGSPKINLAGVAKAAAFFLLERTSDESVSGIVADQIYTGALGNGGEILVLKDAGGGEIDRVNGGAAWENVGGDNESKETAQRRADGVWLTATPTPKEQTPETPGDFSSSPSDPEPSPTAPPASGSRIIAPPVSSLPSPSLRAEAGEDRTTVAGGETEFFSKLFGYKGETVKNARFVWNFGDGEVKEGQRLRHAYRYPGQYVVSLSASTGEDGASDYLLVTVVENGVKIIAAVADYVAVKNDSRLRVDISDWKITNEVDSFSLPPRTFIQGGGTITLSKEVLGFDPTSGALTLRYQNGRVVHIFTTVPTEVKKNYSPETKFASPSLSKKVSLPAPEISPNPTSATSTESQIASVATVVKEDSDQKKWLTLAIFSGLLGGGVVIAARRGQRSSGSSFPD